MRRFVHRRISWAEACAYVGELHRHHKAPRGHRFSLGCYEGGRLCGVAICGRPTSRERDPATVVELTRLCTDGTKDAASFLIGKARKATFALGFSEFVTFTLPEEGGGASLRGAGLIYDGRTKGGRWDTPSRPRTDDHPTGPKDRWRAEAA